MKKTTFSLTFGLLALFSSAEAAQLVEVPVNGGFGAGNGDYRSPLKNSASGGLCHAILLADTEVLLTNLRIADPDVEIAFRNKLIALVETAPDVAKNLLNDGFIIEVSPTGDAETDAGNLMNAYLEETIRIHGIPEAASK